MLSKGLFIGGYLALIIVGSSAFFAGVMLPASDESLLPVGIGLIVLGTMMFLCSAILLLMLYYRMWAAIQDGRARTTPGKAIGFLFIPFFNLYWIFQVTYGFAIDANVYIQQHSISAKRLPEGLFLTYAIFCILGIIPVIGYFIAPVNLIIMFVMIAAICDGVNAINIRSSVAMPMGCASAGDFQLNNTAVRTPPTRPINTRGGFTSSPVTPGNDNKTVQLSPLGMNRRSARLIVVSGRDLHREYSIALEDFQGNSVRNAIGSSPDCQVVISGDPSVGKRHAEIRLENGHICLFNLASTNTISLFRGNSNQLSVSGKEFLRDGDRIWLGCTELQLHVSQFVPNDLGR